MKRIIFYSVIFLYSSIKTILPQTSENLNLNSNVDESSNQESVHSSILASTFERVFGGTGSERGIGIDFTNDGGFIIVGSSASFSTNERMYVLKLDSTGTLMWSKTYNSTGFDRLAGVKQTVDGGYYLSGYITGGFGFVDHIIMKINSTGNVVWARNFGGVEAEELRKLSITSDGGLLVAGYNASFGVGAKEVQAIKLSSNGNVAWAKTYGTLYEDFNSSCIVASDGNYVLSGAIDITGSYGIRPTLTKLDTLGNIIWAKHYFGYIEDWARDLIQTTDGGYLITGDTRSYGLGGSMDIYLIKTNPLGEVEWARAYGGLGSESGYSVIISADGKYVVAGYTNSFGFGGYDGFLMKVNLDGSLDWFKTYGGITSDYIYEVIEAPDGGFALTGRRSSNTAGGDDVWLIKTDENGNSNCAFGIYNPNVFIISNLQAISLNMATLSYISVSNTNLTTISPNSSQINSCAIIPVELKSFNYELMNNKVMLSWSTATETNNFGFELERCTNDKEWRTIGFVTGKGTTTEIQNYSFVDELFGVNSGKLFYRLKQIDYNGQFNYSPELELELQVQPSEFDLYQNYPNPFNPTTTIGFQLPEASFISLKVFDALGAEIETIAEGKYPAGVHEVIFNAEKISSGLYMYRIISGTRELTRKMMVVK